MYLTLEKFRELVQDKEFTVTFRKRTDGRFRRMVAKLAPQEEKIKRWRDEDHNVVTVVDVELGEYRLVPIEGVIKLMVRGDTYAKVPGSKSNRFRRLRHTRRTSGE